MGEEYLLEEDIVRYSPGIIIRAVPDGIIRWKRSRFLLLHRLWCLDGTAGIETAIQESAVVILETWSLATVGLDGGTGEASLYVEMPQRRRELDCAERVGDEGRVGNRRVCEDGPA